MRTKVALVIAGIGLVLALRPLVAHHAFSAEFDAKKPFKFTGPVTKVEWMNPHTFFYIDVTDEKTKKVTNCVEGSMAKDGSPTGNARTVILAASGKKLFAGSSQGNTN